MPDTALVASNFLYLERWMIIENGFEGESRARSPKTSVSLSSFVPLITAIATILRIVYPVLRTLFSTLRLPPSVIYYIIGECCKHGFLQPAFYINDIWIYISPQAPEPISTE
ncbi:hypothetical protein Clacol_000026 [Clathrus columnatus]|uniref:Uncharacterized protein n=1 Tax=Clathrus columnatus TaxID=1419009 RepID=A0AAV4ZY47_9AGAM|nr:hypothetical protein Clacol_000026 [Clathrus columnatus]